MEHTTTLSNKEIVDAIQAGLNAGADESDWDAPEFASARELTEQAGCVWDFDGWLDALACVQSGMLGGVKFRGEWPYTKLSGYSGL